MGQGIILNNLLTNTMRTKFFHIFKIKLLLVLILFNHNAYTQDLSIGIQSGIGSYKMKDLKEINATIIRTLPFEAKITSNYPPFLYYKPSVLISFENISFGFQFSIISSGSRISSKDYSGEYKFDNKIKGLIPGLILEATIISINEKFKIVILTEGGIINSELRSKETLFVNEEEIVNESYFFKSKNYHLSPGFKLKYELNQYFNIELNSSYFIQVGDNNLKNRDVEREIFNQDYSKTSWNGTRIGMSFVFNIPLYEN